MTEINTGYDVYVLGDVDTSQRMEMLAEKAAEHGASITQTFAFAPGEAAEHDELTDVDAVFENFGEANARAIGETTPDRLDRMTFAEGSMAPKIAAACDFVRAGGRLAGIGRLEDARAIVDGLAGTRIRARLKMSHGSG
jgi:hypothetical protein